jgi:hypothetical protein
MTTRLILLLAAALLCWASPLQGQTVKSLGFNTTNGVVVYTGTNTLNFTNSSVTFSNIQLSSFPAGSATGFVGRNSGKQFELYGTNVSTAQPAFFGWSGFQNTAMSSGTARTNLGLSLPALTNTSNVTAMRELAGSTNTNEPFSGSISVVGTNNTNTLVFSNGILLSQ